MRLLLLLFFAFSMGANAMPIKWTTGGEGCVDPRHGPYQCLNGTFLFDSVAGIYSDIDLTATFAVEPGPGGIASVTMTSTNLVDGDQYHLLTSQPLFSSGDLLFLSLTGYDLTNPVTQGYRWSLYTPICPTCSFGGFDTLVPADEPPVVSIPSTIPLLGLGIAAVGYSRRKRKRYD